MRGPCPRMVDPAAVPGSFIRNHRPVQLGNRLTTLPVTLGGVEMPAGSFVTLVIAAANRDPAAFVDPDRLDVTRAPNRHVAFASGAHVCVGLSIARMEGRVAIQRFLKRFPNYRLAAPAQRGNRARFRGFLTMPVELA